MVTISLVNYVSNKFTAMVYYYVMCDVGSTMSCGLLYNIMIITNVSCTELTHSSLIPLILVGCMFFPNCK